MIIAISGTPGCGKTYIAKKLAKTHPNLEYFDLNKYIKDNNLYDSYDKLAKAYDVDIKTIKKNINPILKQNMSKNKGINSLINKTTNITSLIKQVPKNTYGIIVDSHLSHYFESDYCIIVKTDIKKLNLRLKKRNYPKNKIKDNIESEIFDICRIEAKKLKRKIITIEN
jgi:broad-specificity NMP kinase